MKKFRVGDKIIITFNHPYWMSMIGEIIDITPNYYICINERGNIFRTHESNIRKLTKLELALK